jgi:hypothetical protein
MSREELIAAAHEAIELWNKSKTKPLGEPKFRIIRNRPMLGDFPIRWKYAGAEGSKFGYFIYAYPTLEYFARFEVNHGGQKYKVQPPVQGSQADFQEAETELMPQRQNPNVSAFSLNSYGKLDFNPLATTRP